MFKHISVQTGKLYFSVNEVEAGPFWSYLILHKVLKNYTIPKYSDYKNLTIKLDKKKVKSHIPQQPLTIITTNNLLCFFLDIFR